ncbi:MAG: hypothetical protein K0Q55_3159 [Verrucomicrobia bacterium]|jgi:hypothetical protein|nr:hypothetical protein [Verrucomicrobiota bacterium]
MNLQSDKAVLMKVSKDVATSWGQVKESWHDVKSEEFERNYLEPLQSNITMAVAVIEKLDKLLTKVRKDCE